MYEKAIADYVQTDRYGIFNDLKFKALSIEKTADITIADTLKLLQTEFEKLLDEQIVSQQRTLDYFNSLLKYNEVNDAWDKEENKQAKSRYVIDASTI